MEFIINKNSKLDNDCHKIHLIHCSKSPTEKNIIKLGECVCPVEAIRRAKEYYENVNFCKYCCKEILSKCHIRTGKKISTRKW